MKLHTRSLIRLLSARHTKEEAIVGCELGVWEGENAEQLLREFPNLSLWMVDHYQVQTSKSMEKCQQEFDTAWKLAMDRTIFANGRRQLFLMESEEGANRVLDQSLDFCFIDASHDYVSTKRDIELWLRKMKPTGLLCGHDYNGKGDKAGIFGVKKAVDEFLTKFNGLLEVNVHPGLVWSIQLKGTHLP